MTDESRIQAQHQNLSPTGVKLKNINIIFADFLAIMFWLYSFLQLFIFDLDSYISKQGPSWISVVVTYKLSAILALLVLGFAISKRLSIHFMLYVMAFPLIFLILKIPKFLIKKRSWVLFFSLTNLVLTAWRDLKYNLISNSLAAIAVVTIITTSTRFLIFPALAYLLAYVFISYFRTIALAFSPSEVFTLQKKLVSKFKDSDFGKSFYGLNPELKKKKINTLSESQLTTYASRLQAAVLFSKGCTYFAYKMEEYKGSRVELLFLLFSYVFLFIQAALAFSFINLGISKLYSGSFSFQPSYVQMLYYSFTALTANSVESILPITNLAISVKMIMSFLGVLLLPVVILNLVIGIKEPRMNKSIDEAVIAIRKEGEEMEDFIRSEYNLTAQEAVKTLVKINSNLGEFIHKLSASLERHS